MKNILSRKVAGFLITSILSMSVGVLPVYAVATAHVATIGVTSTSGNPCLGTALTLNGGGTIDPVGQISAYHVQVVWSSTNTQNSVPITLTSSSSPYSYTFTAGPHPYTGTPPATVTVKVYHSTSNGNDSTSDATATVPTCPVNHAPVLDTIGNQVATELVAMSFTAHATDVDGNTLTYSIVGAPAGSSFNTTTGAFAWTPSEAQGPGVYPVTISVTDGLLTDSKTFNITVSEVNVAPVLAAIGNQTVNEANLLQFTIFATDADLPANTLTYSATNLPVGATFNPTTRVFSWTPTYSDAGTYANVHFEVSDGVLTDSEDIMITVNNVNRSPVLDTIGNKTVHENSTVTFEVTGSDPDGDTLAFSASPLPLGATFLSHVFSWVPDFSQAGNYIINFLLSDGNGGTDNEEVHIDVGNVNRAPNLNPIGNQVVTEMVQLSLTATATDPDGNTLAYSLSGEPTGMTIDSTTGVLAWTPTEAQGPASYTFDVKVSDGTLTDTETITVLVNEANIAPVAVDDTKTTLEDTALAIPAADLLANDTDTDIPANTLTVASVQNATHGTAVLSGTDVIFTPVLNFNGTATFEYLLSDGTATDTALVTVTVTPMNDAPTIVLNGANPVNLMVGGTYTENGATGSDVEDGVLAATTTGTVNTGTVGVYVLTYTVADSGELSASTTRTVNVTATPVVDVCPNIEGTQSAVPEGKQLTDGQCVDIPAAVIPPPVVNGGAVGLGFLGGNGAPVGLVLGASTSTGEDLPASCGAPYLTDYLRMGTKNNPAQVILLQTFLNKNLSLNLPVTGYFGTRTHGAVKQFQTENADQVLAPWASFGLTKQTPTGYVYKTTRRWINLLECKTLNIPMPQLP